MLWASHKTKVIQKKKRRKESEEFDAKLKKTWADYFIFCRQVSDTKTNKSRLEILKVLPPDSLTIKAISDSYNLFMMVIHVNILQNPIFQWQWL